MNIERVKTLSKKLYKSFSNAKNPTDVYTHLKSNNFVQNFFNTGNLDGDDFVYLTFLIFFQNQGKSPEEICNVIKNNIMAVKIAVIEEEDPSVECDNCNGGGNISCDSCYGDGYLTCSECDGSGEVDCDECGGDGEYDNGNSCDECSGGGTVSCNNCDGDGNEDCSYCEGDGNYECLECDGSGEIQKYDYNKVEFYNIITVSPSLKSFFEVRETYDEISYDFFDGLLKKETILIWEVYEDVVDDFNDDFNDGQVVIDLIIESPKFNYFSNQINIRH